MDQDCSTLSPRGCAQSINTVQVKLQLRNALVLLPVLKSVRLLRISGRCFEPMIRLLSFHRLFPLLWRSDHSALRPLGKLWLHPAGHTQFTAKFFFMRSAAVRGFQRKVEICFSVICCLSSVLSHRSTDYLKACWRNLNLMMMVGVSVFVSCVSGPYRGLLWSQRCGIKRIIIHGTGVRLVLECHSERIKFTFKHHHVLNGHKWWLYPEVTAGDTWYLD